MVRKVWITFLVGVVGLPVVATAHNVGHLFLPDGTCQQIGSGKEAPFVGKDRTQLDLVPQTPNPPRDEFGVSFVGSRGQTAILPGLCPVVTGAVSSSGPTSSTTTTTVGRPAGQSATSGYTGPFLRSGPKRGQ
jgi:hypothetical protein